MSNLIELPPYDLYITHYIADLLDNNKITLSNSLIYKNYLLNANYYLNDCLLLYNQFYNIDNITILNNKYYKFFIYELEKKYNTYFINYNIEESKKISKYDRSTIASNNTNLVYGEVTFSTLSYIFYNFINIPKVDPVFVDLGSGTGRSLIAAAMLANWKQIIGIEILPGLHKAAEIILDRYQEKLLLDRKVESERNNDVDTNSNIVDIKLICGDFLKEDWSYADIIFINSTCFEDELMKLIGDKCSLLKRGSYVIILTRELKNKDFLLLHSDQHEMSWGKATVSVYIKNI